jgi:hypothetical protein
LLHYHSTIETLGLTAANMLHTLHEKLKAQGFTVFLDEEEYARGDHRALLCRMALKNTHTADSRIDFRLANRFRD